MPPKKKKRKPRSRARGTATPAAASQAEQTPAVQERRRERLEARREAKAREAVKRRRQQRVSRIARRVAYAGAAAALIWFLFLRTGIPDEIRGHEIEHYDTFATESAAAQLHTGDPIRYESDPPVSGAHRPIPADCGVYSAPMPKENMVHTLEHGAVGVFYNPEDADPDDIAQIEELVQSYDSHTFSAPYPTLEDPYTVVAWAHLMRLDEFDRAAIREFIEVFREGGDAPEEQDCPLAVDSSFGATPSPTPTGGDTPGPTKSPDKEKKND
ncbi:MAG: DUF3105 domain-containing protein [Actinobacteria bacterium]|nr:DUF3105 domain-containing protein [Actinomycetota bacterium]